MPRRTLVSTLRLGALLALAAWLGACAPSMPPTTPTEPGQVADGGPSLRTVPVLATLSGVLESGRESFEAGRYAVAGARFEAVLARDPENPLATAYLGLCHWFAGRPEATAALWDAYPETPLPAFAAALRAEAAALEMLADRLRARGLVQAAFQGQDEPLGPGLAVLAPPRLEGGVPGVGRALLLLLHGAVGGLDAPRLAPWGLMQAVAAEAGLDPQEGDAAQGAEDALLLARLVGAQYAVTATLAPAPGAPGMVRTRLAVQSAEPAPARLARLGDAAEQAARTAADARQALALLDQDLAQTAFGLQYFEAEKRLDELLAERSALQEHIAGLHRARSLTAAAIAIGRLERLEETAARAQQDLRALEQATVGLAAHIFAYNAQTLAQREAELRATRADLEARATELTQRAGVARAEAMRRWPPGGLTAEFDLPGDRLTRWPALAARAVGDILGGRPLPGTLPAAFGPDAGPDTLLALDRALAAREAGDPATAREQFALARPLVPRPPGLPAPDFDLAAQAGMAPGDIAALYAQRLTRALDDARAARGRRAPQEQTP